MNVRGGQTLGDLRQSEQPPAATGIWDTSHLQEDVILFPDESIDSTLPTIESTSTSSHCKRSLPDDNPDGDQDEGRRRRTTTGGTHRSSRSTSSLSSPKSGQRPLPYVRQSAHRSDDDSPGSPRSVAESSEDIEAECLTDGRFEGPRIALDGPSYMASSVRHVGTRGHHNRPMPSVMRQPAKLQVPFLKFSRHRRRAIQSTVTSSRQPPQPLPRLACPYQAFDPLAPPHCGAQRGSNQSGGFENFSRIRYVPPHQMSVPTG